MYHIIPTVLNQPGKGPNSTISNIIVLIFPPICLAKGLLYSIILIDHTDHIYDLDHTDHTDHTGGLR